MTIKAITRVASAGVALALFAGLPAAAGELRGEAVIACENGHSYPLVPIAVSDAGDIVTARLYTTPRHGVHVRLIPMGEGYRYAGAGVWLDGIRTKGVLNFDKAVAVACEVTPSVAW
jgi:hypothetical protein